jgi:antagonist of KipI
MSPALRVVKPGMLTTVQDLGRRGYQALGVPVAGPMDWYSHRLANRLVGNDPTAAALEITMFGPELIAEGEIMCAVAGGEFDVTTDGRPQPLNMPFTLGSGSRLRIGSSPVGARAALAIRGGIDVVPTLGSRSTHLVSKMGPLGGQALQAGDRLPVGAPSPRLRFFTPSPLPIARGGATIRIVAGAHRDRFTNAAWQVLVSSTFTVTPQSNRMGYRLEGPALEHVRGADILSEATPIGAMQVPSSGQLILLMADRQTTGGYTTIANVVTADLPVAGQLAPGDRIRFEPCTHQQALDGLRARMAALGEQ